MLIGELAKKTGLSRDTIRFYIKKGIIKIKNIQKRINNYRDYDTNTAERLSLVSTLKGLGFTLEEIKKIISLWDEDVTSCEHLLKNIDEKITMIDQKIENLKDTKDKLLSLQQRCSGKNCDFVEKTPSCLCNDSKCCS